jgi:hypothetical protein
MDALGKRFTLKPGSIKEPNSYLGASMKKFSISKSNDPDKVRWAFKSLSYVAKAMKDIERELTDADMKRMPNVKTPLASGYRPELDMSPELGSNQLNYFKGIIGILRWISELGRIDIIMPVSILSRYLVSARQGHHKQVFHIFAYLKITHVQLWLWTIQCQLIEVNNSSSVTGLSFTPTPQKQYQTTCLNCEGKSTNLVVLKEAEHSRSLDLWVGVTCNADRDQNDRGIEIQVAHDGRS